MSFKLTINGQSKTVDVPADMPLLWVIRDVAEHEGHEIRLRHRPMRRLHRASGRARRCAPARPRFPLRRTRRSPRSKGFRRTARIRCSMAWQEIDVPQCGYCQAGQMMSASALLAKTPQPTDEEIDAAMNGNICRCGTYLRIRQAIHKAASIATHRRRQPSNAVRC